MASTEFSAAVFIRTGGSVSFEERPATSSDLDLQQAINAANSPDYVPPDDAGLSPRELILRAKSTRLYNIDGKLVRIPKTIYSDTTLDGYVVRRAVVTVSGSQRVETTTLQAGQLAGFLTPGAVTPFSFKMPDGAGSAIPEGSYMLQEFSFRDQQNGYTDVEVTYRMCQKWELIKL